MVYLDINRNGMSSAQISAIKFSVQMGRTLKEFLPQISEDFRRGKSLREIANSEEVISIRKNKPYISESSAVEFIRYALMGYHSNFKFLEEENYGGLMSVEEYKKFSNLHHSNNALRLDKEMKESGRGIYGIPLEERSKNGRIGSATQIREKIGIHSHSREEKKRIGKLGAIKAGYVVWSDREKELALEKATSPNGEYQRNQKTLIGKIANELNKEVHGGKNVRSAKTVGSFFEAYNKGKRQ